MGTYLTDDEKMAKVSEAKIQESDTLVDQLNEEFPKIIVKQNTYNALSKNLAKIKTIKTHEVNYELVKQIDNQINQAATILVDDDHETSVSLNGVTGTEDFGLSLTPKVWIADRISGMENILSELAKDIKRWANKQEERLKDSWVLLSSSADTLSERLEEVDKKLSFIDGTTEAVEVPISSYLVRSLMIKGKVDLKTLPTTVDKEIAKVLLLLKVWEKESTEYKNKVQRYFGNAKNNKAFLNRRHPSIFSLNAGKDKENDYINIWSLPHSLIGDSTAYFQEVIEDPDDTSIIDLATKTSQSGYYFYRNDTQAKDSSMGILSIEQIEILRNSVQRILTIIKSLADKNSPVNFIPSDVKDILNSLKQNGDKDVMEAYSITVSKVENNVENFKRDIAKYLTLLASHLITIIFIHMEQYDDA